jgi:hypothetical protein
VVYSLAVTQFFIDGAEIVYMLMSIKTMRLRGEGPRVGGEHGRRVTQDEALEAEPGRAFAALYVHL